MLDIDEILAGYGIPTQEDGTPVDTNLSDVDADEALSNYGFTESQDETQEDEYDHTLETSDYDLGSTSADTLSISEIERLQEQTVAETMEELHESGSEDSTDIQEQAEASREEQVESTSTQEETPSTDTPQEQSEGVLLPLNSPTLLIDDSTSRFSGAEWYREIQKARIIIGGMGGISSHLAFNLARMAPALLNIYDDDIVETANMSGQLYSWDDVGLAKVDAIETTLRRYTSVKEIYAHREKFTSSTIPGDIMLCGFDNMAARKTFFESWKGHLKNVSPEKRKNCLFIDGRLSLTVMQIFCITGDDEYNIKRYSKEYLFSDAKADGTVCSMKQTTYLASMIGAMMTNLFTNFIANTLDPIIPYSLPFFTEYDAQYMIFKTVN